MFGNINLRNTDKALRQIEGCDRADKLVAAILKSTNDPIRQVAFDRLRAIPGGQGELARLAREYRDDPFIRNMALDRIKDVNALKALALEADGAFSEAVLDRIRDDSVLGELAIDRRMYKRAFNALRRIRDPLAIVRRMNEAERFCKDCLEEGIREDEGFRRRMIDVLNDADDPELIHQLYNPDYAGCFVKELRRLHPEQQAAVAIDGSLPEKVRSFALDCVSDGGEEALLRLALKYQSVREAVAKRLTKPEYGLQLCKLDAHDFVAVGHDHERYGEHIEEYDIYECRFCKQRYKRETGYWKW